MRTQLFKMVHDENIISHMGRCKTLHALTHFCYWFRMHDDVRFWIKTCDSCQRRKAPHPTPKAPMKIYLPGEPGQRIAMDVCGPLRETSAGNKYVLVISDYFSKYTEAYPMKDQTAETIANIVVKEWFVKKGPPEELHTDQGANFESNLMKEICRLYDIDKTRTTPYHPQGDGQVERFNRSLMQIVTNLVSKDRDWDESLGFAFSGYNATIHETTSFTPNMLWHGRELRNTVGNLVPTTDAPATSYTDYATKLRNRIDSL
jgi:transposase InsO family protein